MTSEGSCDTEDWNNDAENSALHHSNKLHFKIYSNRQQLNFSYYKITVFTGFQINKCSLCDHEMSLKKKKTAPQTFER